MKKLSIIGKGTVGCLTAAHFLRWTDWEIDWIYDPKTPAVSVGEGTALIVPRALNTNLGWTMNELIQIGGTVKQGIYKQNWGNGKTFLHAFPISEVGVHFSAIDLQKKIFEELSDNPRINLIENKIDSPESLDSDYVMVCAGTPKNFDEEYAQPNHISVNSCFVTQCYWDSPRFTYTLTVARPYGWVFGIPLKNRCSIGYVFNNNITDLEQIKQDIENVFSEYNLTPSNTTNLINFKTYYKKNNFSNKVVYNGNASFFLEPLEATSTSTSDLVSRFAWDIWHDNKSPEVCQQEYETEISNIESMICLHYMSGSNWENNFWNYAKSLSKIKIDNEFKSKSLFSNFCFDSITQYQQDYRAVGTWEKCSYKFNIEKLGIKEEIINLQRKYNV